MRTGLLLAVAAALLLLLLPPVEAAPLQCAAQSSQAAFPPTPDRACVCVDGWTGTLQGVAGWRWIAEDRDRSDGPKPWVSN